MVIFLMTLFANILLLNGTCRDERNSVVNRAFTQLDCICRYVICRLFCWTATVTVTHCYYTQFS